MAVSKKQQALMDLCDRCVQLTRDFMNDWLLFNQILSAYPSPGVNKAQLENQFLKVKSKLAREHQVIKDTLGADYRFDASIINIISSATNLEAIYSQSEVAVKKLQNEWHRAFISINETLGTLENKKSRADEGEKVAIGNEPLSAKGGGGGPMDPGVKTLLILVSVLVVIGLIIAFAPFAQSYRDIITDLF